MTDGEEGNTVEEQSDSSAGADQEEGEVLSPREQAKQETKRNQPDVGYHLIERDTMKEPWKQNTALTHTLKLSEMSVPGDNSIIKYHALDDERNRYNSERHLSDDEVPTETEKSVTDLLDDIETACAENDEKDTRLLLAQLAEAAKDDASSCVDAVGLMITVVESGSQPTQAEALGILQEIARVNPEILSEAIEPTISILEEDVHPKLTAEAFKLLSVLIPSHPGEISQAVPTLSLLLHGDDLYDEPVAKALSAVAQKEPAALTNVAEELGAYIEVDGQPKAAQKSILAALGRTAKEHPEPVVDAVPSLIESLDSQYTKVRVNSAGVLADVADTHPTAVEPAVPQAIELLTSNDTRGRHNAASIMAHVAKTNPDAVQPALNNLIKLLEADDVDTRINACSAVKQMNAESALPVLKQRRANDPDKEMRQAAKQAVDAISES